MRHQRSSCAARLARLPGFPETPASGGRLREERASRVLRAGRVCHEPKVRSTSIAGECCGGGRACPRGDTDRRRGDRQDEAEDQANARRSRMRDLLTMPARSTTTRRRSTRRRTRSCRSDRTDDFRRRSCRRAVPAGRGYPGAGGPAGPAGPGSGLNSPGVVSIVFRANGTSIAPQSARRKLRAQSAQKVLGGGFNDLTRTIPTWARPPAGRWTRSTRTLRSSTPMGRADGGFASSMSRRRAHPGAIFFQAYAICGR